MGQLLVAYLNELRQFHLDALQTGDVTNTHEMAKHQALSIMAEELAELPWQLDKLKVRENPATKEKVLVNKTGTEV